MSIVKIYDKADGDEYQVEASRNYLNKMKVGTIAVISNTPSTIVTMCKSHLEVTWPDKLHYNNDGIIADNPLENALYVDNIDEFLLKFNKIDSVQMEIS